MDCASLCTPNLCSCNCGSAQTRETDLINELINLLFLLLSVGKMPQPPIHVTPSHCPIRVWDSTRVVVPRSDQL